MTQIQKKKRVAEAVLMLKIFDWCIESQILPSKKSPCRKRLLQIIGWFGKPKAGRKA